MRILPFSILLTACCATSLAADDGWTSLFNGKDLTGWVQRGGNAKFTVEDGCIVGSAVPNTGNSFLCTKETYGDFILEADFKDDPALNSGVQFRSECFSEARTLDLNGKQIKIAAGRVHGYQCEIDMDATKKRWWTAGIYDEGRRGWLCPAGGQGAAFTSQGARVSKPNDWNHIRIEATGDSLRLFLNGEPRGVLADHMTHSGFIALQVHSIGKEANKAGLQVRFKNIRLKTVTAAPAQSTADAVGGADATANTLSDGERSDGWQLLWDGKTDHGWRSARAAEFPKQGWKMRDGILSVRESGGAEAAATSGGDIITRGKYANFELKLDFKITPGANSGIKIFVDPALNQGAAGSSIGPEFQILDDARHPDAKLGRDGRWQPHDGLVI